MRISHLVFLSLSLLAASACSNEESSDLKTDSVSRHIVGAAIPVGLTRVADQKAITESLLATREMAWRTFAEVIAQSNLQVPTPDGTQLSVTIPRVFTWYSPEDVNRLMNFGLGTLSEDDRNAGVALTSLQWGQAQTLFDTEFDRLSAPLKRKWARFFDPSTTVETSTVIGTSGLNRTLFSPDLIASVTSQYVDLQNCFPDSQKPATDAAFKSCWTQTLPASSVLVKANWLSTEAGFPKVNTDAASLEVLMNGDGKSWESAKLKTEVPASDKIVTARTHGKTFVLGGIHIVTKELDDWLWISAWWSDTPDTDFGEDRPEFIKELGAPWNQYKICAVSSFSQDPAELEKMAITNPSLAAAYKVVLDASGASWCSNPYIERGVNNHKTNCIGCHQFAGTDITEDVIISDTARFPDFGNTKQRQDFPTDYIWAASQGQTSWLSTLNNIRLPLGPSD